MNEQHQSAPHDHGGHTDPAKAREHMAALSLLQPHEASHVAVRDGVWSAASTWAGGRVPGAGADVHVPDGVSITYDAASSATLGIVRVDGALRWATGQDTLMVVDTLISTPGSTVTIGTATDPVEGDVSAEIVIADGGRIDLRNDPLQLSRGLVLHGEVEMHGETKAPYATLAGDVSAGARQIKLDGAAEGWSVGDRVLVVGTENVGEDSRGRVLNQDEERVVTAISRGVLTLDRPLDHDHAAPDGHDFDLYVANLSRNVTVRSEDPDGVRGHVMVMHSPDAEIRYAAFEDLGRTDTSTTRGTDDNPNGRYPLHLHRTGVEPDAEMAVLVGNVVDGGPGWGIVHHESAAIVDWNVVTRVEGAGIVSETGNETGQWVANLVTGIPGDGDGLDHVRDELEGQFGHAGVAYESQSRLVIQQDNVAANSSFGWTFRADESFKTDPSKEEIVLDRATLPFDPDPLGGEVVGEEAQIMAFEGNTAIAVGEAFNSGHRVGITQETDLHSQITDFTVWNSDKAIRLFNYTGNYVIKDSTFVNGFQAVFLPGKHEKTNLVDVTIDGFSQGVVNGGYNADGVLVDVEFRNTGDALRTAGNGTPLRVIDGDSLTMLDAPEVEISSSSDLVLSKGGGHDLFIAGTITDSAGSYGFANNRWIKQPHSVSTGLKVEFEGRKWLDYEEAFELYGAVRENGGWTMPVTFWVSDRVTGEPHAVMVPVELRGFSDAELTPFEIDAWRAPNPTIEIVDSLTETRDAHGGGGRGGDGGHGHGDPGDDATETPPVTGGVDDEPGHGDGGHDGGDGGMRGDETPPTPPTPREDGVGGGVGGDGATLVALSAPIEIDGRHASALNLAHDAAFEVDAATIALTFEADRVDGTFGIVSKDSRAAGDGDLSVYVQKGVLIALFEQDGEWTMFKRRGIEADRAYDLEIDFGPDGVSARLDGTLLGQDAGMTLSWEDNVQHLQVGALSRWHAVGTGNYGHVFDGTISGFSIATGAAEPDRGGDDGEPAAGGDHGGGDQSGGRGGDAGDHGGDHGGGGGQDDTPVESRTVFALDAPHVGQGGKASVLNLAHDAAFEVGAAAISMSFELDRTDGLRGLLSKDAKGGADDGDLSIYHKNDRLVLVFEDGGEVAEFEASGLKAGRSYDLDVVFGPTGVAAALDGAVIGVDRDIAFSWEGNDEFFQVGALGRNSAPGDDGFRNILDGTITELEIVEGMAAVDAFDLL